jgi:hypothetical protein
MGTTITDPVEFLDDGTVENVKHEICRAVLGKDGSLNIDCSDRGCGSPNVSASEADYMLAKYGFLRSDGGLQLTLW